MWGKEIVEASVMLFITENIHFEPKQHNSVTQSSHNQICSVMTFSWMEIQKTVYEVDKGRLGAPDFRQMFVKARGGGPKFRAGETLESFPVDRV
jgi:hypothetical protein